MFAGFVYILRGSHNGTKVELARGRDYNSLSAKMRALIAQDADDGLGNTSADYSISQYSADFLA